MRIPYFLGMVCVGSASTSTLSLDLAIKEALENSPQVQILKENRANSEAVVQEVGSVIYPKIDFNASAGVGQSPMGIKTGNSGSNSGPLPDTLAPAAKQAIGYMGQSLAGAFSFDTDPRSSYRWGFSVTQPIYTFGKLSTAIQVAKYQDSATAHSYRRGRQDVQIAVVESYSAVVMAIRSQSIMQSTQKRSQELRDFLKRNFDLGSGSKSDLLRAEAALTQVSVRLAEAERDVKRAKMSLNQIMGRDLDLDFEVDTAIGQAPWMKDALLSETELFSKSKQNRSDLRTLEMQGRIYAGGETIDNANYLPSIALQGKLGISAYDEIGNAVKWENRDWSIGVGLSWTLFDGWANKAKATGKRIQSRILEQQNKQTQRQIQVDLARLLREIDVACKNQVASAQMATALAESRDLLGRDFKAGKGSLSDVLGIEESLEQAQMSVLLANWQELRARAQLRYVQGQELTGE